VNKVDIFEFISDSAAKVRATANKEVLAIYEKAEAAALELATAAAEKGDKMSPRFKAALVELNASAKADKARIVAEAAGLQLMEEQLEKPVEKQPEPAESAGKPVEAAQGAEGQPEGGN
jgi:hypothetical protein